MAKLTTQKSLEREFARLIEDIQRQATPFINDSTAKKETRKKRGLADPFFFAATYFPHYITLKDGFNDVWKTPEKDFNWIGAGFAECHPTFFKISELRNRLELLYSFRESAKDTLVAKIETIRKIVNKQIWYHAHVAFSDDHATSKIIPLKLEFEHNERLISDFGKLQGSSKWEESDFVTNTGIKVKAFGRDMTMRGTDNNGHRPDWFILNDIFDSTKQSNPSIILKYVESIKKDVLKSANSPRWGGVHLGNYISKQSVEHEMYLEAQRMAEIAQKRGLDPEIFGWGVNIFPVLVPNPKKTEAEREIASQCRIHKFSDFERSIWESRHPTIRELTERLADPDTFDAEMMMRPQDKKNAIFKDDDFKYYAIQILRRVEIVHYTFGDPSVKIASDYKALITLGVPKQDYFESLVIDAWIRQASIEDMLEETFRHNREYKPKVIGVEGIGFAMLLENLYRRLMMKYGPIPLLMVEKVQNKVAKIQGDHPDIKSGRVKFVLGLSQGDQNLLVRQYKAFPDPTQVSKGGIGDDGPDALSECKKLIQLYPPNSLPVGYTSGQKRETRFKEGAF
ncbi:MAG: hypothetical protein Q8L88_02460 [Bacteroidota bacterium]|nr:hypothetical protein [Bacteroidota bacterium]